MQASQATQTKAFDPLVVLERVDAMLLEKPDDRASVLRRLREMSPQIYQQWLLRTAGAGR
jgi:hypothetical protein